MVSLVPGTNPKRCNWVMYAEFSAYPTTRNWLPSGKLLSVFAVADCLEKSVGSVEEADKGILINTKVGGNK